jgi:hypothetical protein
MSENPDRQMNVDQLERELRKLHESQRTRSNDPLDELARIVQQEDPFAIAGARRAPAVPPPQGYGSAQPAPAAQPVTSKASTASVDARLAEFRAMLDQRAPRPAPAPAAQEIRVEPRVAQDDPFRQPSRPPTASADVAFDLDDVPDDIRLPRSYAEREPQSRRASPFIRVAMPLLAVAVIGGGGVFAYTRFNAPPAAPQTASAPVIKAPETPAKVAPPAPKPSEDVVQASKVLEPKAEDPKAPQSVVSTVEQPVDLKQAAPPKDGPRVIPLETGQGAPVVVLPDPKPLPPAAPVVAAKPPEAVEPVAQKPVDAPKPVEAVKPVETPQPVEQAAIPPKPVDPPAPAEAPLASPPAAVEAPKPETPAVTAAPVEPVAPPVASPPPIAAPQVAVVEPTPETPAAPSQPETAPTPVVAAPVTVTRTRMKAIETPVSLATIADEDLPGPGISNKPRRVKSVRVDTTDPALTRSVRPGGAKPAAAKPAEAPPVAPEAAIAAAPEAMPLPAEPDARNAESEQRQAVAPSVEPAVAPKPKPKPKPAPKREAKAEAEKPAPVRRTRESADGAEPPPRLRTQSDAPISLEPGETAATRTPSEQSGGSFAVQFSAPNTEADANAEAARVKSRFGVTPRIVQANVNGRTVYRVRAAGLSRERANALCSDVKSAGGNCFVSNTN